MKKIKLNSEQMSISKIDGYILDPTEKYVSDLNEELDFGITILQSCHMLVFPPAFKNWHAWLFENGFSLDIPNPTNEFVSKFYGVEPLWKTAYSMGIVVKAENDEDYYIIMECSDKNTGFKHTQIILTMGGCM
ncbi:hypothetical protein [Streptococcus lactarius]|uniref:Uncharacterized protein n=1 Tax=Streptococcus lactarius TaxID=684066 RepID=A0A9X0WLP3_9STRE|nr:hypothetical protein [Streptococcus lactarius]MBK4778695.1 hypothetical protein [Streptococcus lactarius]QUB39824.1 hypothetical protein J4854_05115 [Streptococcus lactarius]